MSKRKKKLTPQEETFEEKVITPEDSEEKSSEEVVQPEVTDEPSVNEAVEAEPQVEETPEEQEEIISEPEIQTQELVYLGTSEKATVRGKVTGQRYEFYKDSYNMPVPTTVDERDASGILALEGKACCGKDPNKLFITKVDWDIEINNAKKLNR